MTFLEERPFQSLNTKRVTSRGNSKECGVIGLAWNHVFVYRYYCYYYCYLTFFEYQLEFSENLLRHAKRVKSRRILIREQVHSTVSLTT